MKGNRAAIYLEAVAYLLFTGDVATAREYCRQCFPNLADHCNGYKVPGFKMSQEAGMLILGVNPFEDEEGVD